jgi:hypothetical protein
MLYAFGFERVGAVVGDLYFVNRRAARGQEGAEHGVRLEIVEVTRRLLDRVRAGELGRPPQVEGKNIVRTGWL